MTWQIRHEGSPRAIAGLTLTQIQEGLRDGLWEPTDEVMGPDDKQWVALENHPQLAETVAELEPPTPHAEDETHLDMNALIDVCLVLLIFFILTTTYVNMVQKVVPLPSVSSEVSKQGARKVRADQVKNMIRLQAVLDEKGQPVVRLEGKVLSVFHDKDRSLDVDKLSEALRGEVRGAIHKTDLLLDARKVNWGMVIGIQDAAKAAGVRTVHHVLVK